MSNKEIKFVNTPAHNFEISKAAIEIRDQFQKAGYATSFTHHFAKRPKGTYPDLMTPGSLEAWSAEVHCGKTIVCIYDTSPERVAISIYSPTSADVANYDVCSNTDNSVFIEGLIELFPNEATLYLTETSTDEEVAAQLEFLQYRRPSHPFNPISKPLTDADIQEAIRGLNMQEGIPLGEGQLLETVGEEQAVVVGEDSSLPTFDENNEDADLNKIADEREGQARISVDVESL